MRLKDKTTKNSQFQQKLKNALILLETKTLEVTESNSYRVKQLIRLINSHKQRMRTKDIK